MDGPRTGRSILETNRIVPIGLEHPPGSWAASLSDSWVQVETRSLSGIRKRWGQNGVKSSKTGISVYIYIYIYVLNTSTNSMSGGRRGVVTIYIYIYTHTIYALYLTKYLYIYIYMYFLIYVHDQVVLFIIYSSIQMDGRMARSYQHFVIFRPS